MFRTIFICLSIFIFSTATGQLKSPEQYLGYPPGNRFTPHWRVVNYFKHVAENAPNTVKLQSYGETYEGRELLVTFVSTPENIRNLEEIRKNNLRLANIGDNTPANENAPAIVWLSYNVHGNEASSSEAAMLTLFSLADPANSKTKDWLKNLVVIIDPCINPDGRDRHVNWFNSVVGKNPDPSLNGREHSEPWPGGRPNHYNFDLNRDWAWQTQIESQQRMKLYNQWLPQVHVDYHEMGIDAPYYFAPAAEPYHEVITPWQRSFQETLGRNHARYFDENAWLYFTKEEYDLYYPSYGDTYPIYNGAIGMTYEQAGGGGGGRAGTAVVTSSGDTLTLYDRLIHHYTTSLSTIEISSKNADRLIKEFHKFFKDAMTPGIGEYKSYIIKNIPGSEEKLASLLKLLDKNGIFYRTPKAGNEKGYNYNSRKEENFSVNTNDVLVSAQQPKSAMVKVLFEPNSKLVDSLTYDITAWALPYLYGLNVYASKQNISAAGNWNPPVVNNQLNSTYGFAIQWKGVQSARTISQLLKQGVKLRFVEQPFELSGQRFDRGSVLILRTGNPNLDGAWNNIKSIATQNGVQLYPISTGFVDKGFDFGSSKVHFIKAPKIALITGDDVSSTSAGDIWFFLDQELDYPVTLINSKNLLQSNWSSFDILIMPNGDYSFLNEKTEVEQLKNWISNGGKLIAVQEAVAQLSKIEWAIKPKKNDDQDKADSVYGALRKYENRERESFASISQGSIYKVELDNSHPLAFGYPGYYYTIRLDDHIYEFMKDGWNVGIIRKDEPVAGFVGYKLKPKMKDALLFGVQNIGAGSITYLADNVLFRNFLENGKLMFANAVFFVGQ